MTITSLPLSLLIQQLRCEFLWASAPIPRGSWRVEGPATLAPPEDRRIASWEKLDHPNWYGEVGLSWLRFAWIRLGLVVGFSLGFVINIVKYPQSFVGMIIAHVCMGMRACTSSILWIPSKRTAGMTLAKKNGW